MLLARVRLRDSLRRTSHKTQPAQQFPSRFRIFCSLFGGGGGGDVAITIGRRSVASAGIVRKVGGSVAGSGILLIEVEAGSDSGCLGIGVVAQGLHTGTDHDRIWLAVGDAGGLVLGHRELEGEVKRGRGIFCLRKKRDPWIGLEAYVSFEPLRISWEEDMALGEREKRLLYLVAANGDGGGGTIEGDKKQKKP